jgi:hypothetical protein
VTLAEAISAIRDKFLGYLADGIAFARYDPTADASRNTKIHRIADVFVKSNEVLLLIDPERTIEAGPTHLTIADLLARLSALAPDYAQYPLEACEPEIKIKEENMRVRFDYPILTTGRAEGLQLYLLVYIEQQRKALPRSWWRFWQRAKLRS